MFRITKLFFQIIVLKKHFFKQCVTIYLLKFLKLFLLVPALSPPTSDRIVLLLELVDWKCRVQSLVAYADLGVLIFPWFSPISRKYGLGSLRKTSKEGTPPRRTRSHMQTIGLNLTAQHNPPSHMQKKN